MPSVIVFLKYNFIYLPFASKSDGVNSYGGKTIEITRSNGEGGGTIGWNGFC